MNNRIDDSVSVKKWGAGIVLGTLCIVLAYAGSQCISINSPFLHGDDQQEIAYVNSIGEWWQYLGVDVFGLFRPIKNLLFLIFSKLSSIGMPLCRAVAIFIGIASFFPIFSLFRRILDSEKAALLAAAIWLLSPTLASSVAWLSCVNIQLMCAFSALAFCRHIDGKPIRAGLWMLLACVSYELAIVVGPIMVAYDFFLAPEKFRSRTGWRQYALYAFLTVAYLVIRKLVGGASQVNGSFVGCTRLDLIFASAYFTLLHFYTWLVPFGRMAVFGSYTQGGVSPFVLVACWGVVAALLVSIFAFRKRLPVYSFGIAMAFLAFLPVSNLLGFGNGPYGDYYLGISSMGFALACVAVLSRIFYMDGLPRLAMLVVGAIFLSMRVFAIAETAEWVRCWGDAELAYRSNVRTFPSAYYAHVVLARVCCDSGMYDEALAECDLADALTGPDDEKASSSYHVRALCAMMHSKDAKAALDWISKAEAVDSHSENRRQCNYYRGCVYEDLMNDVAMAAWAYENSIPPKVTDWNSDTVQRVDRYARLLAIRGELERACSYYERAVSIDPSNVKLAHNYAAVLAMLRARKMTK